MGWRAEVARERDDAERLKALPWRERYPLHVRLRIAILIMIAAAFVWAILGPAFAAPIDAADIHVIDGDTIRVHHARPDVRLVGFNAPETSYKKRVCDAERELGEKATRRLRALIASARELDFEFIACSCSPGTEGTMACNYARRCGTLKVDGRDVGDTLVAEQLAVPFKCGATRCPRTPRPWCEIKTSQ